MADASVDFSGLRIALVHDWLYTVGGAERVLGAMLRCLPGADVHCLFDTLAPADRARIGYATSRTTFLQRLPGIRRRHRAYLPLMPLAIEQLDLGAYDLVISSSFVVAKGVLTGPDQLHLAYVHSPMRYAWDLQHEYLRRSGVARGLKGAYARMLLHYMRLWDTRTASGPDAFIANSHFVARRMRKAYGRTAEVIHPPVAVPARPGPARKGTISSPPRAWFPTRTPTRSSARFRSCRARGWWSQATGPRWRACGPWPVRTWSSSAIATMPSCAA